MNYLTTGFLIIIGYVVAYRLLRGDWKRELDRPLDERLIENSVRNATKGK